MDSVSENSCSRMIDWFIDRVVATAKGSSEQTSDTEPSGRFWLGRLTSEDAVASGKFGDRSDRMEPCAIGIRVRVPIQPSLRFNVLASACAWAATGSGASLTWFKTPIVSESVSIEIDASVPGRYFHDLANLASQLGAALGVVELQAKAQIDVEISRDRVAEIAVLLVNSSPEESDHLRDTGLYETHLEVSGIETIPFLLESLPDSFRYDRRIEAYGINCCVKRGDDGCFRTLDATVTQKVRPGYWGVDDPQPDFSFSALAADPLPCLRDLVAAHHRWTGAVWSQDALNFRGMEESWTDSMRAEADAAAREAFEEYCRLKAGLAIIESNALVRQSFQLMNEAMAESARSGSHGQWRPFQLGFQLANVASILGGPEETQVVDILWFATGGGKTETYLGLLVMAAFHERLTGKSTGITAWSRFPLRLLSLQQTQRFADALAGAELVRRRHEIPGDAFALGFFVGSSSTPNRILQEPTQFNPDDPYDDEMPKKYQILLRCPFCGGDRIRMKFDYASWRLLHCCENSECQWPFEGLPIYVVDEEIYRFLPTVVVGTLDKVALISMQASMRGFAASPNGLCSEDGHGFTYASRATRKSGCLVPGCRGQSKPLPIPAERFAPTFRLQDELHLLRDSLGAIDAHYERLLDSLTECDGGHQSKVVASSATLTGFKRQCDVLYGRQGRVFPMQGPTALNSFWSIPTNHVLRKYVSLAPRGATLEFAADRIVTVLQQTIRELNEHKDEICTQLGISTSEADQLVSLYGTDVVYGNTIRDLDASVRSLETQIPVQPLICATLTGQTPFQDVRTSLDRLQNPEAAFDDRIHVVAASSMMSHGVDVDRLNLMVMLGVPLATAEFIQATARIGRRWPGAVFVLHKMALERDASVYRAFETFVIQGDRFVEAIPVTKRSCRVLERTLPGLVMARLLHVHEPSANQSLTQVAKVREFFRQAGITDQSELEEIIELLHANEPLDEPLRETAKNWLHKFFRELNDPATTAQWPSDLSPTGPVMRSLRDVEEQAPIVDRA